jgi:hypothetical protein
VREIEHFVPIVTPEATLWVPADELEPWERSVSASHVNNLTAALGTNDYSRLRDFEDVRLGGYRLATRQEDIEDLSDQGDLDFDAFYLDPNIHDAAR